MYEVEPIYDERAKEILRGLTKGQTRDALAEEFGHKNYKTLDIYMRRRNFTWDRSKKTYVPMQNVVKSEMYDWESPVSTKAKAVISLFQQREGDAKSIAKKLGFNDHREMADYMRSKGFQWSPEAGNYLRVHGEIFESHESQPENSSPFDVQVKQQIVDSLPKINKDPSDFDTFLPLLEMLERNKEKLIDLIIPNAEEGKVPRYIVPGIFVTKSVHMTNTLDQMVRDYSKEKNISQRDIFTVALIEFFRRYGYESQVNGLLGNSMIARHIK